MNKQQILDTVTDASSEISNLLDDFDITSVSNIREKIRNIRKMLDEVPEEAKDIEDDDDSKDE